MTLYFGQIEIQQIFQRVFSIYFSDMSLKKNLKHTKKEIECNLDLSFRHDLGMRK